MLLNNRFPTIFFSPDGAGGGGADDTDKTDDTDEQDEENEEESEDQEDQEDELNEEDDEDFDKPRAMKLIRKLRTEIKDGGKLTKAQADQLASFEKAEKKKEDAEKTEIQKLTDERDALTEKNTTLTASLQEERIGRAIELEAYIMGFADPKDAYHLITANSPDAIKYDPEKNIVKGHKKLLEELGEEKPYLISEEPTKKRTPRRKDGKKIESDKAEALEDLPASEVLDIPSTF